MKTDTTWHPIRLALIGAGIFASEVHLPALQSLAPEFEIRAVFSRTRSAAGVLARQIAYHVDAYDDLAAIMARPDIEAVDIVLPILVMPPVVEMALAAGKHVISEKPMAPDMATGRRLLATYSHHPQQVWVISENMRYEAAYVRSAEMIRDGEIGRPLICHWALRWAMNPENKYYHTAWRKDTSLPGGLILDGGIHHAAALRFLLGDITAVSAIATHMRPDLPAPDTLSASFQFANGALGSYSVTFAAESRLAEPIHVVGDRGTLQIQPQAIELTSRGTAKHIPFAVDPHVRQDVRGGLAAFAAAIREGQPHRNPPDECLRDLAVIEAMLRSADTGQRVSPEQI